MRFGLPILIAVFLNAALLNAVGVLSAQTSASASHFDAASVRANHTLACDGRWYFTVEHGSLNAENAPLLRIISRAYGLTDDRVLAPTWTESECYDIRAKASGDVADRDVMAMLQTLLKERFHLAGHYESADRPVYNLVADKGGPKLKPSGGKPNISSSIPKGQVLFMVRHMPDLIERLGKVTGRPVVDKTGLTGDYTIVLTYAPVSAVDGDSPESAAGIFSAVRDQLGLRLESGRAAVDVLKIDNIDKVPAEN
jgi:uncharacterized protein (TIGR03435 family)